MKFKDLIILLLIADLIIIAGFLAVLFYPWNYFDNDPYTNRNNTSSIISEAGEEQPSAQELVSDTTPNDNGAGLETIENATITAYTTRPEEGTTCISYYGENLCYRFYNQNEMLIACPAKYNTSTLVEIQGIVYRCADRMAKTLWYENRFDIYMGDDEKALKRAREWGIRNLNIKIYAH